MYYKVEDAIRAFTFSSANSEEFKKISWKNGTTKKIKIMYNTGKIDIYTIKQGLGGKYHLIDDSVNPLSRYTKAYIYIEEQRCVFLDVPCIIPDENFTCVISWE